MLALLAGAALSFAGSVPRGAARPASLRLAASRRCSWPVATEAADELRVADDAGDSADGSDGVYEVVLARPVGMQLRERPGSGVTVSMVYEAGNAANEGVRVGDVVLATSASIGPQMWEKSTVAGVESAIRTRVDGKVRLRLRRGTQRPPLWDVPLQWTYDVELGRPLGLVLRDSTRSGQAAAIEVAEVVAGSSAAADGRVRAGDLLLATSASFGEQMWQKSTLEGVSSAISTRLALNPTVRLQLQRTERLGLWAREIHEIERGERQFLSLEALRSLRGQRREMRREIARDGARLPEELESQLRRLGGELARQALRSLRGRADAPQRLERLQRRLRSAGVPLDPPLCTVLMSAALRLRQPRLALRLADTLVADGAKADAHVCTLLVKAHAACGQRAEALAILPRMLAEQVPPSVQTYNTLMSVCARASDRKGLYSYFKRLQKSGLRPTTATYNVLLSYHARRAETAQAGSILEEMAAAGVPPDVTSYTSAIQACVRGAPDMEAARELLEQLRQERLTPDTTTLNTLLGGHATLMQPAEAFELLESFEREGVRGDSLSYSLLMRACVRARASDLAERALRLMQQEGLQPSVRLYAMVMSANAQPGGLPAVLRILREMQGQGLQPDRFAFSALMEACVVNRQPQTALAVFDDMLEQGVESDTVSLTLRLRALIAVESPPSAASLQEAIEQLQEMATSTAARRPNAISYNAVLEGCVQAGAADEARAVLRMLLAGRVAPTRATHALLARFGREARRPTKRRRGRGAPRRPRLPQLVAPRSEVRAFLLSVLDLFEEKGRRPNGEVYLALLRVCEPRTAEAERAIASRGSFDLRRADADDAARLEEALTRAAPSPPPPPPSPPPSSSVAAGGGAPAAGSSAAPTQQPTTQPSSRPS